MLFRLLAFFHMIFFFPRELCLRIGTQAKDEMAMEQGLREDSCVCVCVCVCVFVHAGGLSLKQGSHMCDTSPEEAGLNPRGW